MSKKLLANVKFQYAFNLNILNLIKSLNTCFCNYTSNWCTTFTGMLKL